jgi:hypothetical protein
VAVKIVDVLDEEWFGVVEYEQWKAKVKARQEKEQTND